MRKNRSRAALAVAAITATIPAVAAVGPVSALGAGTHSHVDGRHTEGGLLKAAADRNPVAMRCGLRLAPLAG